MARASTHPGVVRPNSPVMAVEAGEGKAIVGKAMVSKAPSFYEMLISLCCAPSGVSLTVMLNCILDVVLVFRVRYCREKLVRRVSTNLQDQKARDQSSLYAKNAKAVMEPVAGSRPMTTA